MMIRMSVIVSPMEVEMIGEADIIQRTLDDESDVEARREWLRADLERRKASFDADLARLWLASSPYR